MERLSKNECCHIPGDTTRFLFVCFYFSFYTTCLLTILGCFLMLFVQKRVLQFLYLRDKTSLPFLLTIPSFCMDCTGKMQKTFPQSKNLLSQMFKVHGNKLYILIQYSRYTSCYYCLHIAFAKYEILCFRAITVKVTVIILQTSEQPC